MPAKNSSLTKAPKKKKSAAARLAGPLSLLALSSVAEATPQLQARTPQQSCCGVQLIDMLVDQQPLNLQISNDNNTVIIGLLPDDDGVEGFTGEASNGTNYVYALYAPYETTPFFIVTVDGNNTATWSGDLLKLQSNEIHSSALAFELGFQDNSDRAEIAADTILGLL